MSKRSFLKVILFLIAIEFSHAAPPTGHWLGILKIKPITYRIYLKHSEGTAQVFVMNPKANEIPLDTLFFKNDSLYFKRDDFYSTFKGKYSPGSNTIQGFWTDDGHKKHPITFRPINPDTLTGLHPKNTKTYVRKNPAPGKDGLKTSTPEEQHVNPVLLESLSYGIVREQYPNIQSLLIARNGAIVYEDYFYGWKSDDLWLIQSVTKSFVSALVGIALSKGEVKNLDDPICYYLDKYKDKACNDQNRSITIRQVITMTTGLDWNELEFDYYDARNTANQCGRTPDPFECVLSKKRYSADTTVFAYNSMNHSMMNQVLRKSTSMSNGKELKKRLLDPLQITQVNMGREAFGVIGDIGLTPRDMMKFGMLYINDGLWNGVQVIPVNWIKESTTTKIKISDNEGYGYFWWTKQFKVNEKVIDTFYAWGYGGQYIFVVPSLQLVVTMTASNWIMDEKKYAFEMMEKFVLPACD